MRRQDELQKKVCVAFRKFREEITHIVVYCGAKEGERKHGRCERNIGKACQQ